MRRTLLSSILILCLSGIVNAQTATKNSFNVRDFGAVGDGTHLDSPAINQAIEAAAGAGGGTVLVPAGTYLSGSIHLKSHIHLFLDAGATLLGAPADTHAYDPPEPFSGTAYQDAGHTYFHNSLVWGENLTDVSITGPGKINGGRLGGKGGNKSVALKLCRGVLLRDITIEHGGWFAIIATGCDNLTIDNITIDTNRDGIDIDCCRNTAISNCRVNSQGDDGICLKSSYALGEPRLTENLTIANCQVSGFVEGTLLDGTLQKPVKSGMGRIKFGTESSGGFRNCAITNCTFRSCRGLAIEEVDGGILENLTVNNLIMTDVRDCAIYITTGRRNRTPNLTTPSRARNILISNVIADGVDKMSGIEISGMEDQPLDGVRLENIRLISAGGGTAQDAAIHPQELGDRGPEPGTIGVVPAYGVYARHVRDLELANIHVSFNADDLRPAASFSDIQGLEIDNFNPQVANGISAAVFAPDVRGLVIRNSPALETTPK